MDLSTLSNEELRDLLIENGVQPGPVVPTTRKVYEAKLAKILIGDAVHSAQETSPPSRVGSGGSPKKSQMKEASDSDGEGNETFEGEESFRKVEAHGTYEVPLSGNLYPKLPNMSLRPAEWFEENSAQEEPSGLSRRSVISARTATPTTRYSNGNNRGVAASGDVSSAGSASGGGGAFWIKLLVFLVSAIFVFMLLKRLLEGEDVVEEIDQDYVNRAEAEAL